MKALHFLSVLFVLQFVGFKAHAFRGQDNFKVEVVKPWGEFGFRALGKGKNLTEMRFDCGQAKELGLVVTAVNEYGKSSNVIVPALKLGSDKYTCQKNLSAYFANSFTKRGLASLKKDQRSVQLNVVRGGFFSDAKNSTAVSFR